MTWKLIPLKKITTKIGSGATPRGGNNSYKTEGITLIRSLNVYDFEFSYGGLAFINEEQASETRLARVIVEPQDILLNITGASVARCCIVPEHLLPARVNQHVSLVRVDPNRADSHYVLYCINSPVYKHQLLTLAQGGATREALTQKIIGNLEIPLPPIPIQRKIANFLDCKTQQINELIRIKEQQIELLKEQRTTLINQAVTKGLDPNVGLKPSGVEWIGGIPTHWKVKRLKYIADLNMGQSPPSEEYNSDQLGTPFLQGNAEFGPHHPTPKIYCPTANKHAIPGNILLSVRAPVGAINIADQEYGIGRGLCAIRPRTNQLERRYAKYLLEVVRTELYVVATGSTYDAVTVDEVFNMTCVVPPISEQTQVADFLDRKTKQIDELIAAEQRKIELLKEYRQSLISEAVTGKIDVRSEV